MSNLNIPFLEGWIDDYEDDKTKHVDAYIEAHEVEYIEFGYIEAEQAGILQGENESEQDHLRRVDQWIAENDKQLRVQFGKDNDYDIFGWAKAQFLADAPEPDREDE